MGFLDFHVSKAKRLHGDRLCYQTEAVPTLEDAADLLRARLETQRVSNLRVDNGGENGKIEDDAVPIPRGPGARGMNYDVKLPDGTYTQFVTGTYITNVKVIAGKGRDRQIDEIYELLEGFGGDPLEWQKKKGLGYIEIYGESHRAEVHWYEEPTVGRVKFKVKRLLDI